MNNVVNLRDYEPLKSETREAELCLKKLSLKSRIDKMDTLILRAITMTNEDRMEYEAISKELDELRGVNTEIREIWR